MKGCPLLHFNHDKDFADRNDRWGDIYLTMKSEEKIIGSLLFTRFAFISFLLSLQFSEVTPKQEITL
jgi:hypothetical protein